MFHGIFYGASESNTFPSVWVYFLIRHIMTRCALTAWEGLCRGKSCSSCWNCAESKENIIMQLHLEEAKLEKHLSDWLFHKFRLRYVLFVRLLNCQHKRLVLSAHAHSGSCWFFVQLFCQPVGNWEVSPIWPSATSRQGWTCFSRRVWSVGLSPFQDIVLTLKDKLSIRAIESFALVLEQQYSITKLLLLHEDELIQKVKKTQTQTFPHLPICSKKTL